MDILYRLQSHKIHIDRHNFIQSCNFWRQPGRMDSFFDQFNAPKFVDFFVK